MALIARSYTVASWKRDLWFVSSGVADGREDGVGSRSCFVRKRPPSCYRGTAHARTLD